MRREVLLQLCCLLVSAVAATSSPGWAAQRLANGPVISFLGQRFAACRGAAGFESAAFDPDQQQFASQGSIYDLCGEFVSAGPDEAPGLAYDAVTQTYWQVTTDRVVRRWDGDAVLDTVFVVPPVVDVPGTGAEALESVRGIAMDDQYVYMVDAGPQPGEITSNAWFKFTRDGTPVKSSASSNALQHLEADPDALFDDIVYAPPSSPVAPGLLLISLEHSGIFAIDTEGDYVGQFRWSWGGLPAGLKLNAFAGLTIDPGTGNLYLVDNDTGRAQVWVHLEGTAPTGYVVGTGSSQATLQWPTPGCNLPLWRDLSPGSSTDPTLMFGLAYRSVDALVYGYDFGTGQLWKFSPLVGEATAVGDLGPVSVWGLAYDTERDVLYAGQETGQTNLIYSVDPNDGVATALPSQTGFYFDDLAFDPLDHMIYAVTTSELIRIDRDTGIGQTVAPFGLFVRGLTWDPFAEALIGITNGAGAAIVSIDPTSGDATSLQTVVIDTGWEGLALAALPAFEVTAKPQSMGTFKSLFSRQHP